MKIAQENYTVFSTLYIFRVSCELAGIHRYMSGVYKYMVK